MTLLSSWSYPNLDYTSSSLNLPGLIKQGVEVYGTGWAGRTNQASAVAAVRSARVKLAQIQAWLFL